MANKYREEIVGKRFLSVSGFTKLKLGKISEWGWRAGFIRAATHKDNTNKDLQVLVEYDDVEWHRREWLSIYKDRLFHFFLVEQALVWSDRKDPFSSHHATVRWPALSFSALVSAVDMSSYLQPIEFLVDRELAFKDPSRIKPFQDWDPKLSGVRDYPELRTAVRRWLELQDGQRILLTTPSVLVGYRVEVYRAEGTTQWYTAVIIGYNESTRDLTVTDDTVLEEHNEDPALVQMRLIGDGVVESIMRGENVGITPRRSRSSSVLMQTQQPTTRVGRGTPGTHSSGLVPSGASGARGHHVNTPAVVHHTTPASRKLRATTKIVQATCITSSELPLQPHHLTTSTAATDKGTSTKNTRKRKTSESDVIIKSTRSNSQLNFNNINKEDLENKQVKKRNNNNNSKLTTNKKKILEETAATNNTSKLRNVEVRVEDCLQLTATTTTATTTTDNSCSSSSSSSTPSSSKVQLEGEHSKPPTTTTSTSIVKEDNDEQIQEKENTKSNSPQLPAPDLKPEPPPPDDNDDVIEKQLKDSPISPSNNNNNNTTVDNDSVTQQENTEEKEKEILPTSLSPESSTITTTNEDNNSSTVIVDERKVETLNDSTSTTDITIVGLSTDGEDSVKQVEEDKQSTTEDFIVNALDDEISNSSNNVQLLTNNTNNNIDTNKTNDNDNSNSNSVDVLDKNNVDKTTLVETSECQIENQTASSSISVSSSPIPNVEINNENTSSPIAITSSTPTLTLENSNISNCEDTKTKESPLNIVDNDDTKEETVTPIIDLDKTENLNKYEEDPEIIVTTEEEEDCVIVEPIDIPSNHRTRPEQPTIIRECSSRDDDDGPLSSSSPFSRMELTDNSTAALLRFPDDRSDSGVSSLRSGSCASGDERSGSRSSALSSSDEPQTTSSTIHINSHPSSNRSPFNHLTTTNNTSQSVEPVRVWRDPSLILETEPHVRHIDSVQHQTLLMSHPQAPGASASATRSAGSEAPPQNAQTQHMYPAVPPPPPPLLSQYPSMHHHIAAAAHHLPLSETLWKRYPPLPVGAHLLVPPAHPAAEDIERERAYAHDRERMHRERRDQEVRELEKQHKEREKERERIERERERQEREKMEREREKQMERERQQQIDREQERERQEKQRAAEQAVHKHFEESLRLAYTKRGDRSSMGWNFNTLQPSQRTSVEEERKRAEQEHQQREQQRQMVAAERLRERAFYQQQTVHRQQMPSKADYPPPAHSRSSGGLSKPGDKIPTKHSVLPQAEPNLSLFNYPAYQQGAFLPHPEQKTKSEHHKSTPPSSNSGMVLGKSNQQISMERERDMVGPPPLMSELKNTVIVKHEGKSPHHMEQKIPHSPSPKLRATDMIPHYIPSTVAQQHKPSLYEYRSPSQSPHHGIHPHAPSPHHHQEQKQMSHGHHRSSSQLPSPHSLQRQSPHGHPHSQQPHPSPPDSRYSRGDAQMLSFPPTKTSTAGYPPYLPQPNLIPSTQHYTLPTGVSVSTSSKSKVSTAPPHIYGKPTAGIVSGIPVCRSQDVMSNNPIPMTSKISHLPSSVSPSPYQQVSSQYHPPPPQGMPVSALPPPAHSSRSNSTMASDRAMYDRLYPGGTVPGLSVKPIPPHHGTSPPSAAAAPPTMSRSPHQHHLHNLVPPSHHTSINTSAMQTQPLDLGVSSDRNSNRESESPKRKTSIHQHPMGSPVPMEVKKRRVDSPGVGPIIQTQPLALQPQTQPLSLHSSSQPQLARVSEPSPLIASAATTITTVVNTAAYCSPAATMVVSQPQPAGLEVSGGSPMVSITTLPTRPASADATRPSSTGSSSSTQPTSVASAPVINNSPAPSPVPTPVPASVTPTPTTQPPSTPVKVSLTPSVIDSEKSNSPGPTKSVSGNYPVRHLKKAWLQRHTGEDVEDTTGVTGTGSCVTVPITLTNNVTPVKEVTSTAAPSLTTSLHNIGSMAVNSINKSSKGLSNKGGRKPVTTKDTSLNGHATDTNKADDSSSSDQERGRKSPPKRKPPKVKRKKGVGVAKKSAAEELKKKKLAATQASESGSDSDKDTASDKDSDSGASLNQNIGKKTTNGGSSTNNHSNSGAKDKEPRKRGRRPKSSKNDKGEEPRNKKPREEPPTPPRDPFRKPPVGQLKKTGESFLQDRPCFEVAPKLPKCRECRWTPNQRSKNMPNIFCRFYAFRRLRFTKNGQLAIAGFSDPFKDATEDDLKLWLPMADSPPADLDQEMSRFLLRSVGDQFCDLLGQEKDAHAEHMSDDKTIAWKRVVQGVREMCDVCETTLFNFHWACGKCGFVVCLDCYKGRKNGTVKIWGESGKDRDDFSWLLCTNRQAHEQEKLMLTQIIAGDSLVKLGRRVHEARELWNIPQYCECPLSKEVRTKFANGASKDAIKSIIKGETNGIKQEKIEDEKALTNEDKKSTTSSDGSMGFGDSDDEKDGNFSTLRELLIRPSHKTNGSRASSPGAVNKSNKNSNSLDDVISMVVEDALPDEERKIMQEMGVELKHYVRRYKWDEKGREPVAVRLMTLTESREMYPDVPHSWLCDGKLLRLTDANNSKNYKIFQDQWKRGQPVIVSDVNKNINKELWHPDAFARDFGDDKNDLINCMTGNLVPNQPMRKFWEGFEHFSKRLKDERGNPMLLKLKDWPPGEDFAEMLPTRYTDLMKVLPLSEYTHRTGRLNLASRLPECFVRPDLGPKMYNAYGSALHPTKGTTNLHLDVSDAVNVMVYVGIPKDGDNEEHIKEAFRAIDEAGCDILTRRRVRDKGELPGALWHIYHARDADKIRDLLNKVAIERGARLEPHHDPIHDQSCYLDGPLRERLYKEYNVEGYAIVQCLGDAVFIPAGAPHQVRNLHNCIKVAEDFVSPENVSHCFHLTQEFRALSDTHTNHEDKLQIKNIIYHAVKDSLSVLSGMLDTPRCKTETSDNSGNNLTSGGGDATATGVSGSSSDTNSSAGSPISADAAENKESSGNT